MIPVTVEEDGQVVEISLANERVYGDLRLTKVDKDYPDNKLTGAEFEVYRDTNGNKAVSYTHLDVYKRQNCMSICPYNAVIQEG